jgi:hypothetical protein
VRKNYQRKERKSNHKFEVVRGQELLVRVPIGTVLLELSFLLVEPRIRSSLTCPSKGNTRR